MVDKSGNPVYDKNGKRKQKRIYESFTSDDPSPAGRRAAEQAAAEFAANKTTKLANISDMTYGEALDKYIENRSSILSPGTIREYKRSRKRDLKELMPIKLADLNQQLIQTAINNESLKHSPKSVRNMHGLLSAVLRTYRPDFALNTTLPKKVRPKLYVPTEADIQHLMDHVKNTEMELPVLLAAFGPMRRGEICALNSDHVNGNIVYVEFSMALNDKNEWVIKKPKSYAGERYIQFPDFVADKMKHKQGRIVNLLPFQISNHFSDLLIKAGLPHFRFHDLRHYCASIQHAIGIPDAYIMQRGGWGNDGVLKEVYRHVMEEKTAEMNQKANEHFSLLCNTKCNIN